MLRGDTGSGDATTLDGSAARDGAADACVPVTCAALGRACGDGDDGCDNTLDCGGCATGETCSAGTCVAMDCSGITGHAGYELCEETPGFCAGVFTDGSGCDAFCAEAGMRCRNAYGGEPGCLKETTALGCGATGHASDWCECEGGTVTPADPTCAVDASRPPERVALGYRAATYSPRSSWVLDCRAYAYTAQFAEHEACDSQYRAGSGRGTATLLFDVPQGRYDVFISGRHTLNRNPAGMLVLVTSAGTTHSARIFQNDDGGTPLDLHGRYCLSGPVQVVVDSSVDSGSDSLAEVVLMPAP